MNDKINTGGPAFPCHADIIPSKDVDYAGMTLRDYFAAKALPEFLGEYFAHAVHYKYAEDWRMCVAMDAYAMADAMIKAREVSQ